MVRWTCVVKKAQMSGRAIVPKREGSILSRSMTPEDMKKIVNGASLHLYFHLGVKIAVSVLCCLLILFGVKTAFDDIRAERNKIIATQAAEIRRCRQDYIENKCEKNNRAALVDYCQERKECMERDPEGIPTLKIFARYSATLLNEFMNILSPQTIAVIALVAVVVMFWQK